MIKTKLLRQLAAHTRSGALGHEVFDFSKTNEFCRLFGAPNPSKPAGCGTHGCAMGELPIVFKGLWGYRETDEFGRLNQPYLVARPDLLLGVAIEEFFGIDEDMVDHLFYPHGQRGTYGGASGSLTHGATRTEVADHIDAFCDWADINRSTDA